MARAGTGDIVTVKPTNNVYTVLVIIGFLAELLAAVVLFTQAQTIFGTSLFG